MDAQTTLLIDKLRHNPADQAAFDRLCSHLSGSGQHDLLAELVQYWARELSDDEKAAEGLLQAANYVSQYEDGNEQVVGLLTTALRRRPTRTDVAQRLHEVLSSRRKFGRLAELIAEQAAALRAQPEHSHLAASAACRLGQLRALHLEDADGAIAAYQDALDCRPDHEGAMRQLASLYVSRMSRLRSEQLRASYARQAADLYVRLARRCEDADLMIESALDLVPDHEEALRLRGSLDLTYAGEDEDDSLSLATSNEITIIHRGGSDSAPLPVRPEPRPVHRCGEIEDKPTVVGDVEMLAGLRPRSQAPDMETEPTRMRESALSLPEHKERPSRPSSSSRPARARSSERPASVPPVAPAPEAPRVYVHAKEKPRSGSKPPKAPKPAAKKEGGSKPGIGGALRVMAFGALTLGALIRRLHALDSSAETNALEQQEAAVVVPETAAVVAPTSLQTAQSATAADMARADDARRCSEGSGQGGDQDCPPDDGPQK